MKITKNDIFSYWNKIYNDLNLEELAELLKGTFEVDNIDDICKMVFSEYDKKELQLAEVNKKSYSYNDKVFFFKEELDRFKDGVKDSIEKCDLVKDKSKFLNKQIDAFLKNLDQELKLFFINELINFSNEEDTNRLKNLKTAEENITFFKKERFDTKLFRAECEVYYPELIRLLNILVDSRVKFFNIVLNNLSKDINEIEEFIIKDKVKYIDDIILGEGDTHSEGQSVVKVKFDKKNLIYKPRNISIEKKFYDFIECINKESNGEIGNLNKVNSILKDTYSYCEFIEYESANTIDEVNEYYYNLGQLLCLLYVLNGTDIHNENIIARGKIPYLIDLEALFHSQVFINDNVYDEDFKSLLNHNSITVLDIGLLPRKIVKTIEHEDYSLEIGGIGADKSKISPFKAMNLKVDENGKLNVIKEFAFSKINQNNPIKDFNEVNVEEITSKLQDGFKVVYLWIYEHKEYVKRLVEELFKGEKTRVILRPTYAYGKLLNISKEPHFLNSYVHRKVLFSKLALDKSSYLNIVKSEINQLLNNDIPIFYHYTDSGYLYDYNGNKLKEFSQESALSKSLSKIEDMCENDLEREICYIDQAMNLKESNLHSDETSIEFSKDNKQEDINNKEYIELADKIGQLILKRKVEINNNISWISTSLLGKGEVEFGVGPVGNDFYFGNAGIALYLAYLGKYTGNKMYLEEAKRATKFNINFLKQKSLYDYGNIGFHNGIGGVLLSLALVSKIVEISECEEVIKFSLSNLRDLINKDISYDVVAGASGLITSLIELRKIYPVFNDEIAELLELSYNHLFNTRIQENGMCYWSSKATYPYSGYAHGSVGILSSIIKLKYYEKDILGKEIVNEEFIQQLLNYQRNLYSPENRNWKTTHLKDAYSNGWCHGAPGMLLNRCIIKKYGYEDKYINQEIDIALETTIKNGFGNNPTYCHGDLGNIEIIRELAKVTNNKELMKRCNNTYVDLYKEVLLNRWDNNIFRNTESLGIMIGLAGWGYSILRFLKEDEVFNFMIL